MTGTLDELVRVSEKPYEWVKRWKQANGKKVIGVAPMHFPEELVHAAGFLPVVLQESREAITVGHAHVYPFNCGLGRSLIDLFMKGNLDFLDGVLFPDTCNQMRTVCATLDGKLPFPYFEFSQPPVRLKQPAPLAQVAGEYRRVKSGLEMLSRTPIPDEALRASIVLYNRERSLLRKLYDLRRRRPGLLSARELCAAVTAGMVMPKEEHSRKLESLLSELEQRVPSQDEKVRLFLSGHLCHAPRAVLLDLIEEVGAVVADDDLYTGYRYAAGDAPLDGDPIECLAGRYVDLFPPCPTRSDPVNDLGDYLVGAVRRSQAQGVLVLQVKTCEPHIMYYPRIRQALRQAGIPQLLIETEHEMGSLAGVRTRVEAFVEMVKARG